MIIENDVSGYIVANRYFFPTDYEKILNVINSAFFSNVQDTVSLFPSNESFEFFWKQIEYLKNNAKNFDDITLNNYLRSIYYNSLIKNVSFKHNEKSILAYQVIEDYAIKLSNITNSSASLSISQKSNNNFLNKYTPYIIGASLIGTIIFVYFTIKGR